MPAPVLSAICARAIPDPYIQAGLTHLDTLYGKDVVDAFSAVYGHPALRLLFVSALDSPVVPLSSLPSGGVSDDAVS